MLIEKRREQFGADVKDLKLKSRGASTTVAFILILSVCLRW